MNRDGSRLAIGSDDGTTRLFDGESGAELAIFRAQGERWIWCAIPEKRCWRHDDGTLLDPPPPKEAAELSLAPLEPLIVDRGKPTEILLEVSNAGAGRAFGLRLEQDLLGRPQGESERVHLLGGDQAHTAQVVLNSGETVRLNARILVTPPSLTSGFFSFEETLTVKDVHGRRLETRLPVRLRAPHLKLASESAVYAKGRRRIEDGQLRAEHDELRVEIVNDGDLGTEPLRVTARIEGADVNIPPFNLQAGVPAGGRTVIAFAVDPSASLPRNAAVEVSFAETEGFRASGDPLRAVLLLPRPVWIIWTAAAAVLAAMIGALAVFRHPLVMAYSAAPQELLATPMERLARVRSALRRAGSFRSVLDLASVEERRFQEAAAFMTSSSQARAELLAARLNAPPPEAANLRSQTAEADEASPDLAEEPEGDLGATGFILKPPLDRLRLNVRHLLIAFDDGSRTPEETIKRLSRRHDLTLLIGVSLERRAEMRALAPRLSNGMVVAPTEAQMTGLLIGPDPIAALAEILSAQASLPMISLYNGKGAVEHASMFFGRKAILDALLGPALGDALILGGRQLGKSSLLKALQRGLRERPGVQVAYFSLTQERAEASDYVAYMAQDLRLPEARDFSALVEVLGHAHPGCKPFLLLDEADGFVLKDQKAGGRMLAQMRDLASEGRARFVLAGFWGLYRAALDYQSPLRNFGRIFEIGPLEPRACRELIEVPMARMNLAFEDSALIEEIIRLTGGRANLIADLCRRMVEGLSLEERALRRVHLNLAIEEAGVDNSLALDFWRILSGHGEGGFQKRTNLIDQALVLRFAEAGRFTRAEAFALFEHEGLQGVRLEEIEDSLRRLSLSYVLREQGGGLVFCTPMILDRVKARDPSLQFKRLMQDFARADSGALPP